MALKIFFKRQARTRATSKYELYRYYENNRGMGRSNNETFFFSKIKQIKQFLQFLRRLLFVIDAKVHTEKKIFQQ